ncbi:hypothetical protein DZA37_00520 [Kangiella sp. HD9-110m-PIT-SAG06]|nr:hypothetical protein DZA37_00520 [Kangiella sp. HD9-110m-PIT-SAG06]
MRLLIVGILSLLINACWDQDEVIAIDNNGHMKWLVIAKPDWELVGVEGVKSDLSSYSAQMQRAGWIVRTKGSVVKDENIVLGLSGSLQKVGKMTDFYKIHSVNQSQVAIEFLCPIVDNARVYRSIKFKGSSSESVECGSGVQTIQF